MRTRRSGVGLREWGSGEAAIASASLVGQEGSDRLQFLSGEPFELRVEVDADGVPPPRLQLELRDDAGTLVAGHAVDLRGIGWASGNGHRTSASRSARSRSPTAGSISGSD